MAKQTYILKPFEHSKASSGALCIMVKNGVSDKITNINSDGTANSNFMGAGICTKGNERFTMMINGVVYQFNSKGEGLYPLSIRSWKLMLGEVETTINTSGNAATSNTTTIVTRGQDGSTTTKVDYSKTNDVIIDSLNARDEFAVNVLKQLLSSIPNPSAISNNEMNFFCNRAYQWAANMMEASANARGTFTQEASSTTGIPSNITTRADISSDSLSSNTEKLLNNIVSALERTDYAETISDKIVYSKKVKVQFAELIDFLNTYVKGDTKTVTDSEGKPSTTTSVLGLKDIIAAIDRLNKSSAGEVSIGNQGLGRDKDHPFYMTGGGFPTRQTLAASLASTAISDFLTFNTDGAVGYSPKAEVKKSILGWLEEYADLNAFYQDLQTKVTETVDTRVKAWLNATTVVSDDNGGYKLNVPSSI